MRKKDADSVLSLRLPADEARRLQATAETRGVTISRIARQAIAAGMRPLAVAPLSYGIADQRPDVTLRVSVFGSAAPEARTTGGLMMEVP